MCLDFLYNLFWKNYFLTIIQWGIVINVRRSACEGAVILVRFWSNVNFLDRFKKNTQKSNLVKIRSVEAKFHADGQTDMAKLIVAFRYFANPPDKNCGVQHTYMYTDIKSQIFLND
jgi:hypothetical protein